MECLSTQLCRDLAPTDEGTRAHAQLIGRTVTSTHADEVDELDAVHGIAGPGRPVLVVAFVAYDENQRPLTFETARVPRARPRRLRQPSRLRAAQIAVSAPDLLALALVTILGSAAQSATGFGVALPLGAVALALFSPPDAVLTVAAASLMHNLLVLATRHRRLAIRARDGVFLIAAALPGLLVGALVVSRASKPPMQVAIGLAILAAILFRLHEPGRVSALAGREVGLPIGLLAGFLTTTVGINGPPLIIWLRSRDSTFTQLRDTLAMIFLALNVAAIAVLATRGGTIAASLLPVLAAGLIVGHVFGMQAHNRLSSRALDRLVIAILTAAAGASIIAASPTLL